MGLIWASCLRSTMWSPQKHHTRLDTIALHCKMDLMRWQAKPWRECFLICETEVLNATSLRCANLKGDAALALHMLHHRHLQMFPGVRGHESLLLQLLIPSSYYHKRHPPSGRPLINSDNANNDRIKLGSAGDSLSIVLKGWTHRTGRTENANLIRLGDRKAACQTAKPSPRGRLLQKASKSPDHATQMLGPPIEKVRISWYPIFSVVYRGTRPRNRV